MALRVSAFEGMPTTLRAALVSWVKSTPKYKPLYNLLPKEVLDITFIGFSEMRDPKPASFNEWWLRNHNRFVRDPNVKQYHLQIMHQIVYEFLCAFVHNKIELPNPELADVKRRTGKPKS